MTGEFDAKAACLALQARCRAKRTEAEDAALIADAEAQRERQERAEKRRRLIEQARDYDDWRRKQAERAVANEEKALANEMAEVRVAPGPRWTPQWLADVIQPRVPSLSAKSLDPSLGTLALLYAVDRLEGLRERGRSIKSPSGFVVEEAQAVMRGKRTTWISWEEAEKQPQFIVNRRTDGYVGRTVEAYEEHMRQVATDNAMRRKRGLLPT